MLQASAILTERRGHPVESVTTGELAELVLEGKVAPPVVDTLPPGPGPVAPALEGEVQALQ